MPKRLTLAIVEERLRLEQGDDIILIPGQKYVSCGHRLQFLHQKCGRIYWAHPIMRGKGCPHCNGCFLLTEKIINERLDCLYGGNLKIDYSTYVSKGVKARFVYQDTGEEYWAQAENVWYGHHKRGYIEAGIRRRRSIDDVKQDVYEVHGDVVSIDELTYKSASQKARFIDKEHGEWWAWVQSVRQGAGHPKRTKQKMLNTNLERYGVEYVLQNSEIFDRAARKRWSTTILKHWLTGADVTCRASYEVAFVNWCNSNCIDFDWQISHKMPNGRVYHVDAFIKTGVHAGKWIEIKGWLNANYGKQRVKWEWFHAKYPNSELWDKPRLQELGILNSKR